MELKVKIQSKVAVAEAAAFVCENTDYTIKFEFDSEWQSHSLKTARFSFGSSYTDVAFTGDTVAVPMMHNIDKFSVGVFAGNLHTTTPAVFGCRKSILSAAGVPVDPTPSIYQQIIDLIEAGMVKGDSVEMRYFEEKIQWRTVNEEDVWHDLLTLGEIQGEVIAQTLEAATTAANAALQAKNEAVQAKNRSEEILEEMTDIETGIDVRTTAIESKIPNQASEDNQLADKDFVNSSINSAAAFFRGAFENLSDLLSIPWQDTDVSAPYYVSNNDYAYVSNDESHSGQAWRYNYKLEQGSQDNGWKPIFKINDTPFTAAQLAALNSGATSALIASISQKYVKPNDGIPISDLSAIERANILPVIHCRKVETNVYESDEKIKYENFLAFFEFPERPIYDSTVTILHERAYIRHTLKSIDGKQINAGAKDGKYLCIGYATGFNIFVLPLGTVRKSGVVNATSSNGITYTGSSDLAELVTGTPITVVFDRDTASQNATLSVNGTQKAYLRLTNPLDSGRAAKPPTVDFFKKNRPYIFLYRDDGGVDKYWISTIPRISQ